MVYTGKPSRGCLACRRRKIKCDEALPGCSECFRKQIICPGYKAQFDLAWRDQNVVAEKSVQRRQKATAKKTTEQAGAIHPLFPRLIPRPLNQDFQGYAVDFFFSSYVFLPKDTDEQLSYLDCLHPIWLQAGTESPLRRSVGAVSSIMLEAWSFLQPDQPDSLSRSEYTKAIEALRRHLESGEAVNDEILMSALMLQMYENLTAFCKSKPNNYSHLDGTTALVECRTRLPIADAVSKRVILEARNQVIRIATRNRGLVPSSISALTIDIPETAGTRLDDLNLEVAQFQACVCGTSNESAKLLSRAYDLDQRLAIWAATVPESWPPARVSGLDCIPTSVTTVGLYQNHCDVYKSIFVANTLNSYRCSRIKIQLALVTCLGIDDTENLSTALAIIQQLADDICASIPFYLGDRAIAGRLGEKTAQYPHIPKQITPDEHHIAASAYGGWVIAGRLAELLAPDVCLRVGQKRWIGGQLQRVRSIYAAQSYKT